MKACLKGPAWSALLFLLTGLLLLAGCGKTIYLPGSGSQHTQPQTQPYGGQTTGNQPLSVQADAAWKAGNMLEAERLYNVLARDAAQSMPVRALAWERVTRAAIANGNEQGARNSLGFWKDTVPDAEKSAAWVELQGKLGVPAPATPTPAAPQSTFSSGCVALALPLSGAYGPFGNKVAAGAEAARTELSKSNITMDVKLVDTESSDWLEKLSQLPPQCVTVGGPMRADRYTQMKARNMQASHAVFAFLPSLEGSDEGTVAWRFFFSQKDQIDAMLGFVGRLGVSSYGVLAPTDTYGQRMTDLFLSAVRAKGATASVKNYSAGDTSGWDGVMRDFVAGSSKSETPVVQAAFIPDSWKNLELLVPYLFYQGEDRIVLMGTSLWEQGLSNRSSVNVSNLDLAIFPGAWNPTSPAPAANALMRALSESGKGAPGLWEGIGYDFVRMASVMNLQAPAPAAEINSHLAALGSMEWSIAPISWTNGQAAEALFVFRPVRSGFELADPTAFKARYDEIMARHSRRK